MTIAYDSSLAHTHKGQLSHLDGFGTRAIHVGSEPNAETGAVIPPITLSTTFKQVSVGVHKGYEYSRSGNPNRDALEAMLASLESGGAYAVAFSSGSATTATIVQSVGPNVHILSMRDVYGGTSRYFKQVATEVQGAEASFIDFETASDDTIRAALRPNTKLIWIESPTNPTLRVVDIPRIIALARAHSSRPLVVVDNTFLSPFYQSPLLLGADVVTHSLTKYINGHSDVILGVAIVPAHHTAFADRLRFLQNAHGAIPSPYDCWLAQRGAKTLHLRMKAHGTSALRVARALARSPYVEDVIYPGLTTHPRHAVAYRQLAPHARRFADAFISSEHEGRERDEDEDEVSREFPFGGMISFRIRGGGTEANAFLTALRLFALAESLGGVESLAELPAQMTHAGLSGTERSALGIGDNLVRLSVGVEEAEDLVRDVEQALEFAVGDGLKRVGGR